MKKSLFVALSFLFVLSLVAVDYAAAADTQLTISGSIRVRGDYRHNTKDFDSDVKSSGDKAAYDERVRLKVEAVVSPNTKGVIELENGDGDSDTYTWGGCAGAKGIYKEGNCKPVDMFIRQAYIAHEGSGLLGRKAGIKVGHMLLKLGRGIFFNHSKFGDDAIMLWTTLDGGTVSLTNAKFTEGSSTVSDDTDAYVLAADFPLDSANVSADLTYLDDQDFSAGGLHFWNLGARADADVAGFSVYGDVELQSGKAKENDVKYRGYAFLLGADTKVSDVTVGLESAYGSGDKTESTDKYEGFVTTMGSGYVAYLYDDKACTAASYQSGCTTNTGISNTWYIKGFASTKVTPNVKVSGAVYNLRASKGVAINGATNSDGTPKLEKNLGWEIDGKVTYSIEKNLTYYIEGGYLFAGSAYDIGTGVNGKNESSDDAYGVRHGIVLKF